jgi:hypothetical protein
MSAFANGLTNGKGIAVTTRGILKRRDSLKLSRNNSVLSWHTQTFWCTASVPLLQLVGMHRSGCTLKLLSSQTRWFGLAASVKLILASEPEAIMLQDTLAQLVESAQIAAGRTPGCNTGMIL